MMNFVTGKCSSQVNQKYFDTLWAYNGGFKKKSANGYGRQVFANGDIFEGIQNDDYLVEGIMTKAADG